MWSLKNCHLLRKRKISAKINYLSFDNVMDGW
nr:MAG TPA: Brf1-like TBP-binding domain protein [Caudoviricetes sp.]